MMEFHTFWRRLFWLVRQKLTMENIRFWTAMVTPMLDDTSMIYNSYWSILRKQEGAGNGASSFREHRRGTLISSYLKNEKIVKFSWSYFT